MGGEKGILIPGSRDMPLFNLSLTMGTTTLEGEGEGDSISPSVPSEDPSEERRDGEEDDEDEVKIEDKEVDGEGEEEEVGLSREGGEREMGEENAAEEESSFKDSKTFNLDLEEIESLEISVKSLIDLRDSKEVPDSKEENSSSLLCRSCFFFRE